MSKTALAIDYVNQTTHHKFHLPLTVFQKPNNEVEYTKLGKILDKLIDEVRDNEQHPLRIALEIIGCNLEEYDDMHHPAIGNSLNEVEIVKYLMKKHKLFQKDLADIFGSQANVSKFLQGERALNKKQIAGLKHKFGISADCFIRSK